MTLDATKALPHIHGMTKEELIKFIEVEAKNRGIMPSTLCRKAVSSSTLYARLKDDKSCTMAVAERIKAWAEAAPHHADGA